MVGSHACLVFLWVLAAGGAVAFLAAHRLGGIWLVPGFLAGAVAGLFGLYGAGGLYELLVSGCCWLPRCRNGTCKGSRSVRHEGDYEFLVVDGKGVHRCRCGHDYRLLDSGRRFAERLADGTLRPYLLRRPLRGWRADGGGGRPAQQPCAAASPAPTKRTYYHWVHDDRFVFEVTTEAVRSDWGDFKAPVPLVSITDHEVRSAWGDFDELLFPVFAMAFGLGGLLFLASRPRPVDIPTWIVIGGALACLAQV